MPLFRLESCELSDIQLLNLYCFPRYCSLWPVLAAYSNLQQELQLLISTSISNYGDLQLLLAACSRTSKSSTSISSPVPDGRSGAGCFLTQIKVTLGEKNPVSYDLNLLLAEKMAEVFLLKVIWIGSQHPSYDGPVNLSSQVCKPVAESSCSSKSKSWPYRPPNTDSWSGYQVFQQNQESDHLEKSLCNF